MPINNLRIEEHQAFEHIHSHLMMKIHMLIQTTAVPAADTALVAYAFTIPFSSLWTVQIEDHHHHYRDAIIKYLYLR